MTQTTIFAQNSNNPFVREHCKTNHKACGKDAGEQATFIFKPTKTDSLIASNIQLHWTAHFIITFWLFAWSVWVELSEVKHILRCDMNRVLVSHALTSNPSVDPREQGNALVQLCSTGHPSAHTMSVFSSSPNFFSAYQSLWKEESMP